MVHAGDPVGAGLIRSVARPGGNVTGTTNLSLAGKQVELIRQLVPRALKLAILTNPSHPGALSYVADAMEAGLRFHLSIAVAEVLRGDELLNAFAVIRSLQADAFLRQSDGLTGG